MKRSLIIPVTCLVLLACHEKKIAASDVPQAVVAAFNTKYPNASEVEWATEEEDGKKVYEAECKFNGKKIEADFDMDGKFIKEE